MTAQPLRWEWERAVRSARLGLRDTAVALALATWANADGTSIRPGDALVAEGLGVSTRTVERARAVLVERGLLRLVQPGRFGRASEYALSLPSSPTVKSAWAAALADSPVGSRPTRQTSIPTHESAQPDWPVGVPVQVQDHSPEQRPEDPWSLAAEAAAADAADLVSSEPLERLDLRRRQPGQ